MEQILPEILKFNQDNSYFLAIDGNTYSIRHTHPFKEIISRKELDLTPKLAEMYYKTNLILVVVNNTLYFIDDLNSEKVLEREFKGQFSEIRNLKTRRDKFFLLTNIGLFYGRFPQTKKETISLTEIGPTKNDLFDITTGEADIIAYNGLSGDNKSLKVYNFTSKLNLTIENPHNEDVVCMTLNYSGSILASSSCNGQYIRTWRTDKGNLLKQFYTGVNGIPLKLICFNRRSTLLVGVLQNDTILAYDLTKHIDQNTINSILTENNRILSDEEKNITFTYTPPGRLTKLVCGTINPNSTKVIGKKIQAIGFTDDINLNCILQDGTCCRVSIDQSGIIC